jgi:sigma-E factor negative regulatory protein RseC
MNTSECIEQQGIVEKTDRGIIRVRIPQVAACSSCHSKSSCSLFGNQEKTIEVSDDGGNYRQGERVGITITRSMGQKAILLGYFLPFVLVITTLVILTAAGFQDWIAGLASLAVLVPYYILLYFLKQKLSRFFTFTLKKIDSSL